MRTVSLCLIGISLQQTFNVFCLICVGVSVTFVEDYVVGEQEEMFEVCVMLTGATEIDISVTLSAQENGQLLPDTRAISE